MKEPTKRALWDYRPYSGRVLDTAFCDLVTAAKLHTDAQELIECLKDSPRFRAHQCRAAEEELETKRKEVEEAEKAVKAFCYIGAQ